jgi:hypothetical protein
MPEPSLPELELALGADSVRLPHDLRSRFRRQDCR